MTFDGPLDEITAPDAIEAEILLLGYQLAANPTPLDLCNSLCEIDLHEDLRVENRYLRPTRSFVVEFDGVYNETLRVEAHSNYAREMCCSTIANGCLLAPVCSHIVDGAWNLRAEEVAPGASPVLHGVECDEEDETHDFVDARDLILPLNKKVVCVSNCDMFVVAPPCDHLVSISSW